MNIQRHPLHPTNKDWDLYDVCDMRDPRPPKGVSLLCVQQGGVLIISPYFKGVRYWGYKPGIPKDPIPAGYYVPMEPQ